MLTGLDGFNAVGLNMTLNPADAGASVTLSNGNRTAACAVGARALVRAFRPITDRRIWEATVNESGQRGFIGVCAGSVATSGVDPTANASTYMLWTFDGTYKAGVKQDSLSALNSGAVVMVDYDPVAATLKFFVSGSQYGTTMTSVPAGLYPVVGTQSSGVAANITMNFGQAAFTQAITANSAAGMYF